MVKKYFKTQAGPQCARCCTLAGCWGRGEAVYTCEQGYQPNDHVFTVYYGCVCLRTLISMLQSWKAGYAVPGFIEIPNIHFNPRSHVCSGGVWHVSPCHEINGAPTQPALQASGVTTEFLISPLDHEIWVRSHARTNLTSWTFVCQSRWIYSWHEIRSSRLVWATTLQACGIQSRPGAHKFGSVFIFQGQGRWISICAGPCGWLWGGLAW